MASVEGHSLRVLEPYVEVQPFSAFQQQLRQILRKGELMGFATHYIEGKAGVRDVRHITDIRHGSTILEVRLISEDGPDETAERPVIQVYEVTREAPGETPGIRLGLREYWPVTYDSRGGKRHGTCIEVIFGKRGETSVPSAQRFRNLREEGRGTVDYSQKEFFPGFYAAGNLKPNARNIAEWFNL